MRKVYAPSPRTNFEMILCDYSQVYEESYRNIVAFIIVFWVLTEHHLVYGLRPLGEMCYTRQSHGFTARKTTILKSRPWELLNL
jgi:hypothetical protein